MTIRVKVELFGSLALTGKGHGTDLAILNGLSGYQSESVDPESVPMRAKSICENHTILLNKSQKIEFIPERDLLFHQQQVLPHHSNGMRFIAYTNDEKILSEQVYYSIGGGFIVTEETFGQTQINTAIPYPFKTAEKLLTHCKDNDLRISDIMLANEKAMRTEDEIIDRLMAIVDAMQTCIAKGLSTTGQLPGVLRVQRRAPEFYQKIQRDGKPNIKQHAEIMHWLNIYAMAVNEENAAGGRIVTAPTNGAAGIVPAVLEYYKNFVPGANDKGIIDYLLTAGAIAILYKLSASISGAEVGCQGEVGAASSMAAGALAAVLGGTIEQIEHAAEIAMEHHLGMTCDPVAGLVQIPCIERNAMGAVKAVNAAQMALLENGEHKVSLDKVIKTMYETGKDMLHSYKETAKGGLAIHVNIIEC